MTLRPHQAQLQSICQEILAGQPIDTIIASVTPGGGKSAMPVILASLLIPAIADKIIRVVPRNSLKWQGEAEFLDPRWETSKRMRACTGNDEHADRENAKRHDQVIETINLDNGLGDAFKALVRGFETLAEITRSQESRLAKIENRIEARQALLPAPQIKPRDHVSKLVREYAERNKVEFRVVWQNLYMDFGYRTNTNPKVSAQNRGMSIIDYIEAEGQMETLEAVALDRPFLFP